MSKQMVARTEVLAAAQKLVTRGWKADHMGWVFDPAKPDERLGPIQITTTGKKRRTYAVINLSGAIGEQFNTAESIAAGELYGTLEVRDFWTGDLINDDHAGRVEALMETAKQIEKGAK